jgi:uncharacterized protein YndB with AHSA1/START domain
MNAPDETRTVVIEREMPHPPEKVWRALTQPALIAEWLMKNDFRAEVGHSFSLRTDPMPHWDGVVDCEVLVVEPLRCLSYTWNTSGPGGGVGLRTVVTLTLTATTGGVRLRLEQSGFRPEEERNFAGARYGWQHNLGRLERVAGES